MPSHERTALDQSFLWGSILFSCVFAVYLLTICPTVYVGDSGEFIASAFCLGNAHNSGYPLYALIGKIFSLIPFSNIAFRVNVMSAFFGALTVWLTCRIILKETGSLLAAISAALMLAFSGTFWSQTTCAEVYTFHAFFVALIFTFIFGWKQTVSLNQLCILTFVAGLSLTNHLQTLMLAPALCVFVLISGWTLLLRFRNWLLLLCVFALALSIYLYLPIRTEAGAAIHWGDPNTVERFLNHVLASAHRDGYMFNQSWDSYGNRFIEAVMVMIKEYHLILIFAAIGWAKEKNVRIRILTILIILFDTIYTVFLNTISLKITAFQIPSLIVLAIFIGKGMALVLGHSLVHSFRNRGATWGLRSAFACFPLVLLTANFYESNQSENYTAYAYGKNILNTPSACSTLLVGGDNILFPVTYLRLAENTRPDLEIYDRHNLFFKMPFLYKEGSTFFGKWKELRSIIESELVKTRNNVYVAVFNDTAVSDEGFDLLPFGLTYRAVTSDKEGKTHRDQINPWPYYTTETFKDSFFRDHLTRSVTGYFFLKMGRDLIAVKKKSFGLRMLERASSVAYDDPILHKDLAILLVDSKMYEPARSEIEFLSEISIDTNRLYNTWGYYYGKIGDNTKAIEAFKKSIAANPGNADTYNNLGLVYLKADKPNLAKNAFEKSLAINPDQPRLIGFMTGHDLKPNSVKHRKE
jgi:tetratricopeptide (TPR) repeat protein